jgi:Bacteriophage HK97-gp10, putative tail-component
VIRVKVSGVPQYHAALELLSEELEGPELLLPAAEVIARAAQRRAPVKSGRLRSSIVADNSRGYVRVVALARYSPFVHYGSIHNPSPVPFLDLARSAPGVEAAVEREVDKAIARADL